MLHSNTLPSQRPGPRSQVGLDDFPDGLLDATVRHLAHVCGTGGAAIHLLPEGKTATGVHAASGDATVVPARCLERVMDSGEPVQLSETDIAGDAADPGGSDATPLKFYAGLPVNRADGSMIAIISVFAVEAMDLAPESWQAMKLAAAHLATEFELASLRRQRELLPAIVDSLPGVFYILDEDGHLLRWNRRLQELAGLDDATLATIDPFDLFHPEDRSLVQTHRDRTIEQGQADGEARVVTATGHTTRYYFTGHRIDIEQRRCIIGMGLDLSARQAAEEERDRLFNLSPDPLCVLTLDGRFEDLNPAWEQALGMSKSRLLATSVLDLIHPDEQTAMRDTLAQCGPDASYVELRLRTVESDWRWFAWHSRCDPDRGMRYAVARDITKPKALAAALEASEARYRSLVESARDAIVVIMPDGRIESINGAFSETVGWKGAEWVGRNLAELVYEPDLPRALQALSELHNEDRMPVFEVRVRAKDGNPVPVEVQGTQIHLSADTMGALVIARDVRERKAMDQRLQRMQRLDAIGQLAAGVAHDFNNLLQIIHGEVDLLLTHPLLTPQVRDALQNVAEASTRAERITRKLLLLGREHEWQAAVVDLNEIVARFLPMLQRLLGKTHHLEWQPAKALPTIHGDLGMLEQVLMNLLINARDAMPEGGTVSLATRVMRVDAERASRDPDAQVGRYVELAVSDTGTGITPEHLPHIFEPLFTTKPVGEGTGLGLATIYGIVRRHEGFIDVESEVGRGSRFLLYFPIPRPTRRNTTKTR